MGWKATAVKGLEHLTGARVVRPGAVALILEREHLRRFLSYFEVDCVFDVGANAGQYARMLRNEVGYEGFIISYEPIPQHAAALREMAKGDDKWFVEEMALDESPGTAVFNIMAGDQFSSLHGVSETGSSLFREQTRLDRRIQVCTSTVAEQVTKYRAQLAYRRPFLKMDTQGHDDAVVRGAGAVLADFVGLQSELAVKRLYEGGPSFEESLDLYRRSGFELSAFVPNNAGHFPWLLEIDCIMYRPQFLPPS
jgi:FkbM family methyltransferase